MPNQYFSWFFFRHTLNNDRVNEPVQNATYGLFAPIRAYFGTIRMSKQILELGSNYKSEQGGGSEKSVYANSTVDIDKEDLNVNGNENPSLRGANEPSGNTEQDGYDHLGQYCVTKPDTGHVYDTFRNTWCVYDTTAHSSKPGRPDTAYDSLYWKNKVKWIIDTVVGR